MTHNAVITDVEVFLNDVTHGFPDDLYIMLVGPTGRQVLLMSDAGGNNGNALTDVDISFDDEATSRAPRLHRDCGLGLPARQLRHRRPLRRPGAGANGNTSLSVFDTAPWAPGVST